MSKKEQFKRLFEPINIGTMECKNRISMLPMENNYGTEDGLVTERMKNYYAARSKDVGLVIVQIHVLMPHVENPIVTNYILMMIVVYLV